MTTAPAPSLAASMRRPLMWLAVMVCICISVSLSACKGDNGVEPDAPQAISDFIDLYFPLQDVDHTTHTDQGRWVVQIHNGATLTFNAEGEWLIVNGNGSTLPQQMIYDQLPDPLYDYIESMEQQAAVYYVERNNLIYSVTLFDARLRYVIATHQITQE